jgi:hypothetical protein
MEILLHHDDLTAQYAGHFANSSNSSDRHSDRLFNSPCSPPPSKRGGGNSGFQQVGVADIDLAAHEARLLDWLAAGFHGEMEYMVPARGQA